MTAFRVAAVVLLFLAVRVVLLLARDPFFDELWTVWMARHPIGDVIPALLHDSGPPLYYFIARIPSVVALRWMSLIFATGTLALLVWRRQFLAAALLAVYPAAALYAVDARAYALCGLLVAAGVLLLDAGRPLPAAVAFVAAAYSHYYGVLFFPLLLFPRHLGGEVPRPAKRGEGGRRSGEGLSAFLLAIVLYIPGFWLAFHQPVEATAWNAHQPLLAPLYDASFAGHYSPVTFATPPVALVAISFLLLIVAVARSWRFAPAVLIPILLAIGFQLSGRSVYFPLRFESVLAVPLMLWIASSLQRWPAIGRRAIAGALMLIGAVVIERGIVDHLQRPLDPCTAATLFVARAGGAPAIVAGDYCYLHAWTTFGPRVIAFPSEQAQHPGWHRFITLEAAQAAARSLPRSGFVWIGQMHTAEFAALVQMRRTRPLFRNGMAIVLHVDPRS